MVGREGEVWKVRRQDLVGDDDTVTLGIVLGRVRGVLERVRAMRREGKRKGRRGREDGVCVMLRVEGDGRGGGQNSGLDGD